MMKSNYLDKLIRYLYNSLFFFVLLILPFRLLWKSRKNSAYRINISQRFGFFSYKKLDQSIWVHAVSLGETISAIPLIKKLIFCYPNIPIVFTVMTPTAAEYVKNILGNVVIQQYVPYDFPFLVNRLLKHINPKFLVLIETELWPNILYCTNLRKIPIVIANASLSEKSFNRYKKISRFARLILNCITFAAAQTDQDALRFVELGLDSKKIIVAGNMKFDISIPDNVFTESVLFREKIGKNRQVWVAASTHHGEEEKILASAVLILKTFPNTLLILSPRHLERFEEVKSLCSDYSLTSAKYSENLNNFDGIQVLIGDVIGRLLLFYASCDVAFVGGSLVPWGGHNLLEPAALSKPVLSGKYLESFSEISNFLTSSNALIKVKDEFDLAFQVTKLFQDKELRTNIGNAAFKVVNNYSGVTEKIITGIKNRILSKNENFDVSLKIGTI